MYHQSTFFVSIVLILCTPNLPSVVIYVCVLVFVYPYALNRCTKSIAHLRYVEYVLHGVSCLMQSHLIHSHRQSVLQSFAFCELKFYLRSQPLAHILLFVVSVAQ